MIMADVEVLRAACCIAGIDGDVSQKQREALNAIARRVGVGEASLRAMLDRALADKAFYKEQFDYVQKDPEAVLVTLWKVAAIDGKVAAEEKALLLKFAEKLKVSESRLEELIDGIKAALKGGEAKASPLAGAPLSNQSKPLAEQDLHVPRPGDGGTPGNV